MSDELRRLVRRRASAKSSIEAIAKYVERFDSSVHSHRQLEIRLSKLQTAISDFNQFQIEIEDLGQGCEDDELRLSVEDSSCTLLAKMGDLIEQNLPESQDTSRTAPSASQDSMRLPTINVPTFDGNIENWTSFIDTFNALFHNNSSLSNVQRFHYLKTIIIGPAADIIKNYAITSDNYMPAYNELVKQYDNKALIIQTHIRALLNSPKVYSANAGELRRLHHHVISHVRALKALGQPVPHWDAWLVTIICCQLDANTAGEWQLMQQTNELPSFKSIDCFLAKRISAYDVGSIASNFSEHSKRSKGIYQNAKPKEGKVFFTKKPEAKVDKCAVCSSPHKIYACDQFNKMTVSERRAIVSNEKMCYNCLNYGHQVKTCNYSSCPKCGKKHNSKLHIDSSCTSETINSTQNEAQSSSNQNTVLHARDNNRLNSTMSSVMLATAVIYIHAADGQLQRCRAVLDSGSQLNFITSSCAHRLQLNSTNTSLSITGVDSMSSSTVCLMPCAISSLSNNYQTIVEFHSLPSITEKLPSQMFDIKKLNIPDYVKNNLADPQLNIPASVDILLGAEVFYNVFLGERLQLSKHISLHNTKLGWILTGKLFEKSLDQSKSAMLFTSKLKNSALSLFTSTVNIKMTNEELRAEEHFNANVKRIENGRFQVRLPLCADTKLLEGSQQMAKRRFFNLERRLSKDSALSQQYKSFMEEYLELDHMETVETSTSKPSYYLPHHPVFKAGSSTTKVRVVFDGSAVAPSGHSLNDILLKGPKVQPDISRILWRFRIHQVAITADIAKMYRQVVMASEDRDLQRIFYRSSPDELLKEYRLKTVTYGTKSASFLSTRCLVQIAKECSDMSIKRMTLQDFYVDDLISGGSTEDQCFIFYDKLQALLDSAGFHLRKWCSSSPSLLKRFPDAQEDPNYMVKLSEEDVISALGLLWQPVNDCFKFAIKDWSSPPCMTKRTLLSDVNGIYDPIGLIVPVLIKGKIFIQQLWSCKLGWDDMLSADLQSKWSAFYLSLRSLQSLSIPRCTICKSSKDIQIHGFCDASQEAFGGCIYLRSVESNGSVTVKLFTAKSRVAPLHPTTIPRLELCGALLLAELFHEVKEELKLLNINFNPSTTYLWTDSTIVLGWIKSQSIFQVYVSNRLARILDVTTPDQWCHVPSLENPADLISRGVSAAAILHSCLWWHGPSWLKDAQDKWPITCTPASDSLPELRQVKLILATTRQDNILFERYSKWTPLVRNTSWLLRFIHNCRCSRNKTLVPRSGFLSVMELESAQVVWYRYAQLQFFDELSALQKRQPVARSSKIKSLNPCLDAYGVMRVCGRLARAPISDKIKYPIILPSQHRLTRMIFEYEHIRLLHVGPQALFANIQTRFWPLRGRDIARATVRNCKTCFKVRPRFSAPLMAPLPKERVTIERPFNRTGVDFCGPVLIKSGIRRVTAIKCYIAVFVCFVTRAVHLELVTDLTADAFIAALSRFMSRRGMCSHVYSDNATNFVGAHKVLTQYFALSSKNQRVVDVMANQGIQWHFIPPSAPHFGGLWEAAVKSAKHLMLKTSKGALLNAEEMNTLLCKIEAILNSRPMTSLSDDPGEFKALTPSHFLIGGNPMLPQEPDLSAVPINRLRRFQLMQAQLQRFWARWSMEYLPQMQKRGRWTSPSRAIQVGDLAILKEDNVPVLQWKLIRISAVHPGADGVIRVMTVKQSSGAEMKRPVVKVALLPSTFDTEDSADPISSQHC